MHSEHKQPSKGTVTQVILHYILTTTTLPVPVSCAVCLILCVCVCHGVFSVQTLEGCEILLGPEVTYGPPSLDLLCPVAMTIAHCAEVDPENWNIQLKRKTQDSKWEVSAAGPHLSAAVQSSDTPFGFTWLCFLSLTPLRFVRHLYFCVCSTSAALQHFRFTDFVRIKSLL